jgi:hypothetical protein
MDTMVLLFGNSRCFEDDDCACSHNLAGVPSQVQQIEGTHLHVGDDAPGVVISANSQFQLNFRFSGESEGGNIQCFPRI